MENCRRVIGGVEIYVPPGYQITGVVHTDPEKRMQAAWECANRSNDPNSPNFMEHREAYRRLIVYARECDMIGKINAQLILTDPMVSSCFKDFVIKSSKICERYREWERSGRKGEFSYEPQNLSQTTEVVRNIDKIKRINIIFYSIIFFSCARVFIKNRSSHAKISAISCLLFVSAYLKFSQNSNQ